MDFFSRSLILDSNALPMQIVDQDRGAFDSAKNHMRQRRKRQSVTAKWEKSQPQKLV